MSDKMKRFLMVSPLLLLLAIFVWGYIENKDLVRQRVAAHKLTDFEGVTPRQAPSGKCPIGFEYWVYRNKNTGRIAKIQIVCYEISGPDGGTLDPSDAYRGR